MSVDKSAPNSSTENRGHSFSPGSQQPTIISDAIFTTPTLSENRLPQTRSIWGVPEASNGNPMPTSIPPSPLRHESIPVRITQRTRVEP